MSLNEFLISLVATLDKTQSKNQLQSDAKNLGEIKVPLIGTLSKSKTKAQLKQDLTSLNGTVNLTGKVNKKGIVTSVQQTTKQAQTVANKNTIQVSMNLKKDKLINDIKVFGQQNTRLFKNTNMAAKYNSLLDNAKLATSSKEIADLRFQLSAMRSEIKATNLSGLTLGDTLKKAFKRATELFTGTGGVMLLIQQMRQAWTEALNLDKAYTDLIKVQNELSRGDYPNYLEQCNRKAQELAVTQQALIEGATEFSKSGYTQTEANELTEKSTILANVGDMSASDSAKAIISGVQAYDIVDGYDDVIDKAGALIDKYNEIGNTASITSAEIAEGVQSVGSVFADANTSVDEFIALLAAGNRQYQDADSLALGLRTAALRIRGCTTELEAMGEETDGVYTSASKLADKIEGLTNIDGSGGVKILKDDGETFRSIYDIFLDISKVYNDMSDTDQSALLELIAGKHRSSAISATLNNMSEAQEIYQRSLEASGSAQKEYDEYLESSEAALNKFKASMTETYQSVIDGQTVTGLLNCGNATLQFVNSLGLVESTLKGIVAIGIVKAITTLSTAIKASVIQANNFGTALNTIKSMSNIAKDTTKYADALNTLKTVSVGLSETQLKQVLASKALGETERIAILRTTGLSKAQAKAKLAQMGLTESTKAQTKANISAKASTFSLTAAVKGFGASLKAAFMSNPVGIAIMALSTAIGLITSAINSANQKAEEARQKAKDAADTASTLSNEISELAGKYLTLSNAVQTNKSSKEDLMTVHEEFIKKLGIEGETIDSLVSKYGSLDEMVRQVTLDELGEMEVDLIAGVKAAEDELRKVGKDYKHFYSSTNRNLLSSGGEEAVKAYQVLNEAGIISEGSYGTGGGSIVLTGDDSTVDGILENYQKLQDAIQALRESDEFTDKELAHNPVFLQIYNRSQEMKEFVEGYNDSITALNQNVAQQQMLNSLKGMELPDTEEEFNDFREDLIQTAKSSNEFIGSEEDIESAIDSCLETVPQFAGYYEELSNAVENTTDALREQETVMVTPDLSSYLSNNKDLEQSLIQLSKTGKLDKDTIQSWAEYDEMLTLCNGDADKLIQELNNLADQSSGSLDATNNLTTITGGLDSLSEVYSQAMEDGFVESDAITKLYNQFGDLSVFDSFVEAMQNIGDANYDTAQSFHDLADAYINTNLPLTDLTEATKQQYIEELQGNGVTNAKEAIEQRLAYVTGIREQALSSLADTQKYANLTTEDLANATIEEINSMIDAANASGKDTSALNTLAMMKAKVSGNQINESTSISEILSVAKACGITTPQLSMYNYMKSHITGAPAGVLDQIANNAKRSVLNAISSFDFGFEKYNYGGAGKYSSSGSGGSGGSSSETDTSKEYDWIAVGIQRCEEAISRLEKVESNTYTDWSKRNNALNEEINQTAKEIGLLQRSYEGYMAKADSVGLSDTYKQKVQNGTIEIETITDKELQEQIDAYQQWYEEAVSVKDKIDDLNISLSELTEQKFDNIVTQFEDLEEIFTSLNDHIEASIDLAEAKGRLISKNYYTEMLKNENENNRLLVQQRDQMVQSLNEAVKYSRVKEGSEAWHDLNAQISDVNKAIIESDTSIQEFNNSIRELDWEVFDLLQDSITNIADEIEFMTSLLEDESLTDGLIDRGLTGEGIAQLGNYASRYNIYLAQAEKYAEEIRKIGYDIAMDPANQDLINRKQELVDAQRDVILSANEEKQAMFDLARDGYDAVLESLQELIDKRKEALNSEKELYEYQKTIAEKTKNIASIKKQLSVFENDNSEEAKKTVQQLRVDLEKATQDLKDTEYEKFISDQEDMMDQFYQDYSDKIDEKFEQLDILFQELIGIVNDNSESINTTLSSVAEDVGYTMSNELANIWGETGTVISNFSGKFETYSTTIQNVLNGIKVTIDNMLQIAQNEANISVAETKSSEAATPSTPSASNNVTNTQSQDPSAAPSSAPSPSASPSVGERITSASGRWYVDSYGSKAGTDVNKYSPDYFIVEKVASGRAYPYHIQAYKNGKKSGGSGWVKGNQIGYKKGLKESMYDHFAWTQEEGEEIIRAKDGSLLTPISKGTTVFTRAMTNNLWEFAGNPEGFMKGMYKAPDIKVTNGTGGNVEVNIENIALPNVTKPEEFGEQLVHAMQHNNRVVKAMQSLTVDSLAGYNSKRINRF